MKKVLLLAAFAICFVLSGTGIAEAQCQNCLRVSATDQTCWSGEGGAWGACWEEPIYGPDGSVVGDHCEGSQCTEPVEGGPSKKYAELVITDQDGNSFVACTVQEGPNGEPAECASYCDYCFIVKHGWFQ